ncbi:MAG: flagellin [Verrucomicrobia bacterium]|nr:flagellin [Verrucomicrobiota bacterium]
MSVVINTNYAATVASNNLATSNASLQRSLNRLSSGSKIVNPSDDAGGLAVSLKFSAAAHRSAATKTNVANAVSFLQTQDGVLKVVGKILDRMSELATLYTDATKSATDKSNYGTEFTALSSELTKLGSEKFNGVDLFSSISVNTTESGGGSVSTTAYTMASGLAIGTLSGITTAIETLATARAANGAAQSRLEFAGEVLSVNKANLEAANSRITDVDVAEESTQLAKWNVLVQSGTAMLAQANQSAQSALRLLQ